MVLKNARSIHDRLLADRRLQFDFPAVPAQPPIHWPKWLVDLGKFLGQVFEATFPVLKVLFWVGVGLALAAIVFLIVRELAGRRFPGFGRRRRATRPSPADWRPDAAAARKLLADADALAAEGDYDGAVHLILLTSIDDIEGRRPRLVRPALTARDIAALEALPERARRAFSEMAKVVERSLFGGRPAGADGFARCRADYQAFALEEAWG
ncbi:MAG: DUF4129 domain-containing protein [Gemmatimonadales bacterium]